VDTKTRRIRIDDPARCARLLAPAAADLVEQAGLAITIELAAADGAPDLDQRVESLLEALAPAPAAVARLQQLAILGELAAGVTHETRNLLTGIVGFAQIARMRTGDPDAARRHIDLVEREALRCVEILERYLTFAYADGTGPELVDVASVVGQVVRATTHQLSMHRITLFSDIAGQLPSVRCRRGELSQVVLNLVINAMHATPEGGKVVIGATETDRMIELTVTDTGAGVPLELRERIFEPFFTTKPEGQGTGLGLALCRRIVTSAGGTIGVVGEPGRGARFVVRLPAVGAG
jgi:signal transduction histidine kinase